MINNDDNYVVKHGKNVVKAMPFAPSPKSHFLWVGLKPSKYGWFIIVLLSLLDHKFPISMPWGKSKSVKHHFPKSPC